MNGKLLTTKEAARELGVSQSFLEKDRHNGAKVPFIRIGNRAIRYRQEDLDAFVSANIKRSTSEYSRGGAVKAA